MTQRLRNSIATLSDEKGVGLAESLIAVAIVGIAITALVGALSTGSIAVQRADTQVPAENLTLAQMEYTKSQQYQPAPASYSIIDPLPADYAVSATASPIEGRDADIQKITVTVTCQVGTTLTIEDFKVNR